MARIFMPQGTPQSNEPGPSRTPTPNVPLSSRRLSGGGQPSLLSAVNVTPPRGGFRVPTINTRAGRVNAAAGTLRPRSLNAPQETAPQYRDVLGPAIADAGYAIGKAGIDYAVKKSDLRAADANLQYQEFVRNQWLGYEDPVTGNIVDGYALTQGREASEGYDSFSKTLEQRRFEIAESFGNDDTKARFLAKSVSVQSAALNRAAEHSINGTRTWRAEQLALDKQALYVNLSDKGYNPQDILNTLSDFTTRMVNEGRVTPATAAEFSQGIFVEYAEFLSTMPDGASDRLGVFSETLKSQNLMTFTTEAKINKTLSSVVTRENREEDGRIAREERGLRLQRQKNDINLYSMVSKGHGDQVDWQEMDRLVMAGLLSPSTHSTQLSRWQSKAYLGPIPPLEKGEYKQMALNGELTITEASALPYRTADTNELVNYIVGIQSTARRDTLKYGNAAIESEFNEGLMYADKTQLALLKDRAKLDFERFTTGPDAWSSEKALEEIRKSYLRGYSPITSPLVALPMGQSLNLADEGGMNAHTATMEIERLVQSNALSAKEAEPLFQQIINYYEGRKGE